MQGNNTNFISVEDQINHLFPSVRFLNGAMLRAYLAYCDPTFLPISQRDCDLCFHWSSFANPSAWVKQENIFLSSWEGYLWLFHTWAATNLPGRSGNLWGWWNHHPSFEKVPLSNLSLVILQQKIVLWKSNICFAHFIQFWSNFWREIFTKKKKKKEIETMKWRERKRKARKKRHPRWRFMGHR